MDLITAYLLNRLPIKTANISTNTFTALETYDWKTDARSSAKFKILTKRFKIEDQWYRALLRFTKDADREMYQLDTPAPFLVAKTQTEDEVLFKDVAIFHGKKLGKATKYLDKGVPVSLLVSIVKDLKQSVVYEK